MKTIKLLVESNQACSLPWYSAEVHFHSKNITPCCKWAGPQFDLEQGFGNVWNGEDFKSLRNSIINNEVIDNCVKCNDPKKYSYKDYKNKYLERYYKDSKNEATVVAGKIKNLQFAASNICNLACKMCGPSLSSTWGTLVHKNENLLKFFGRKGSIEVDNKNFNKYIDSLLPELSDVESITISGGEPFMDPIVLRLIQHVKDNSKNLTQVSFSTNMTVYNEELFNLLDSMDVNVRMGVSIDGPRDIHNYIRYNNGSFNSFDTLVENLKRVSATYPRFRFGVNTTCGVLNVGFVREALEEFKRIEEYTGVRFQNIKNGPVFDIYLHAGLTPEPYKSQYLEKLNSIPRELMTIRESEDMVRTAKRLLLETRPADHYYLFRDFITELDQTTGTRFENLYWPM